MKVTFDLVFEDTVVIWQMQKEKGHSRRSNSKRRGSAEMRPEKSGGGGTVSKMALEASIGI